jgi:hypothetical protein
LFWDHMENALSDMTSISLGWYAKKRKSKGSIFQPKSQNPSTLGFFKTFCFTTLSNFLLYQLQRAIIQVCTVCVLLPCFVFVSLRGCVSLTCRSGQASHGRHAS